MKFLVANLNVFRVAYYNYCSSKNGCFNLFMKREESLVSCEEGSPESVKREDRDPDEEDLDEDAIDNEDIEDNPTESFFMDDEWE